MILGFSPGRLLAAGGFLVLALSASAQTRVTVEVTAYCDCGKCCGWYRDRLGTARTRAGNRIKYVGVTASGHKTGKGTVAVDTRVFPFGTVFEIPGYGKAVARDRGGSVKGNKIDIWFPTHAEAVAWGKRKKEVRVWYPKP